LALSVPVKLFAGIKWMNCGALMNQFFGNKKTLLFVRERDVQYATEEGAEGLRQ
jgi:hypothetical protein